MNLAGRQILVTGATGFLGRALASRLLDDGAQVRLLVRTPEKAEHFRERSAEIVIGDMTEPSTLLQSVQGCSIVYHAAVDYTNYERQRAVNVEGTRNIVQAAANANVERFVHISTVAAYGSHVSGDVYEDEPLRPIAYPYALTKAEGEKIVQEIAHKSGMEYTIVRPGMIYGPYAGMWTVGLFKVARMRPALWINDGRGSAHLIHAEDVVSFLTVSAAHPAAENQIFNCSADPSQTWREVISEYGHLIGRDWKPISLKRVVLPMAEITKLVSPSISMGKNMPELIKFMMRDVTFKMTKARDLLDWSPRVDLETGIASCVPSLKKRGLL
jgi:nucleoside-diphosphate-sugar epimerase